ncbi:Ribokinase-like protein [Schizophyllum amplum]|uniref:pyridoxal kinase n=1 Tax=Schizophyllum amplum TaxID=97359 RepID=A0A550C230_9AGAR|nr:Ribokinase-like protein [Auriculariopsis ampla]
MSTSSAIPENPGRVLSIQSHVAFGYVGGKAAVFPLQCLGYDVDVVNTVNFSNHSGYGRFGGTRATADDLRSVFDTMEKNELLAQDRLLTGYIPGAEALSAVADFAAKLKERKPEAIYLLDPVMGDSGRLYVAADVIPVYRNLLHLADIITPNWFEVETLTDTPIRDLDSLRAAFRVLHERYHVPHVVLSSIPLTPWLLDALPPSLRPASGTEQLLCLTSSIHGQAVHARCVPLIPGYFSGVGDMFSALTLAHFVPESGEGAISRAASYALAKTHAVLQRTHEYALGLPEDERQPTDDEKDVVEPLRKTRRMRGRELRLIQSQDILRRLEDDVAQRMMPWEGFW